MRSAEHLAELDVWLAASACETERLRTVAACLARHAPGWLIIYGPFNRQFYAFALWPAPQPLVLASPQPSRLLREIGDIELEYQRPAVTGRQR